MGMRILVGVFVMLLASPDIAEQACPKYRDGGVPLGSMPRYVWWPTDFRPSD